jgi:spore germination protein KB
MNDINDNHKSGNSAKSSDFVKSSDFTESQPLVSPKKISVRQVMIIFFFTAVSGITRVVTPESGKFISKASWLAPFAALVPVLLLIYVLNKITAKHKEKPLAELIELIFGKIAGKIILFIFLMHTLFLMAVFLRTFGEKFISTIFPNVAPSFFTIILLMFALVAVRRNIEAFARFAEIAFIIIIAGFAVSFLLAIFHADPKNLYPVTYYDFTAIAQSSVPLISLWSLLTFSLFLGGVITHRSAHDSGQDKTARTMTKFMLIIAIFNFLASVLVIGIFNADTAANMSMPYFMIFKSIKTSGVVQSFEAFFILFWAFTDFIMISYYLFITSKIFKTLFAVEKPKLYMFGLGFILLILAWLIGENNFEVDYFYSNILSWSSIILGFVFPFILLAAGKIRKML